MTATDVDLSALVECQGGQYRPFDPSWASQIAERYRREGFRTELGVPEVHALPDGTFEIESGHHRIAAAREVGWETIPCQVTPAKDRKHALLAQVVGNSWHLSAPASAEARAFSALVEAGMNVDDMARAIGRSRGYVERRCQVMALDPSIRDMVDRWGFAWSEPLYDLTWPTQRELVRVLSETECNLGQWRALVDRARKTESVQSENTMFDAASFELEVEQWSTTVHAEPKLPALIGTRGIADLFGVAPNTPRVWRARGKLPEPTEIIDGIHEVWSRAVIESWAEEIRALA